MQIVKVTVNADIILVESISDYLVGLLSAAVEYSVGDNQTMAAIHAFVPADNWLEEERELLVGGIQRFSDDMAEIFRVDRVSVDSEIIADQDWSKNWKEYFTPFEILEDLVIAPSWEPYSIRGAEKVIVMDPGMAFGTGHHATTRLCLALIRSERQRVRLGSVLDVGTGTGILGMAAALWGAREVVGIDSDNEAVTAAQLNVRTNKLQQVMKVSAEPVNDISATFDLVVANIIHDVLIELAHELKKVTVPGGVLLLSGLISGKQTRSIIDCYQRRGFTLLEEMQDGEWGAVKMLNA